MDLVYFKNLGIHESFIEYMYIFFLKTFYKLQEGFSHMFISYMFRASHLSF